MFRVVSIALMLLFQAAPVGVSPSPPPDSKQLTEARQRFDEAKQLTQGAWSALVSVPLDDCQKVTAAVAQYKLAVQNQNFADERVKLLTKH